MLLQIHPDNPDKRQIKLLVNMLRAGDVIIIPTDSIYALACDMRKGDAIENICKILDKKPKRANLSLICKDLSDLSDYTLPISNPVFKHMKRLLPGPFTFILNGNNHIPRIFKTNRKTIGIRVPDNKIVHTLLEELGNPMISSSIHSEDEIQQYLTEPEEIHDAFEHKVACVIDGGAGQNIPSTVIDCTTDDIEIVRGGLGVELV
jgi:tRNA threonylcarbamoyl adenosine modification protein (Sua5/YciO/YrdC/YwlC family)